MGKWLRKKLYRARARKAIREYVRATRCVECLIHELQACRGKKSECFVAKNEAIDLCNKKAGGLTDA